MTVVIGQVIKDCVFLFCDSALTHRQEHVITASHSTFGQLQDLGDRKVEEAMIKVMRLPRGVIIGLSFQELEEALSIVKQLRTLLLIQNKPIAECVRSLHVPKEAPRVEAVIGWHAQRAQMWLFDNHKGLTEDIGIGRSACIGSLPNSLLTPMSNIIARFGELEIPMDMFMAGSLVGLQAFSVFENLPNHDVGGTFFGICTGPDGVHWQPDVTYAIVSPVPADPADPTTAIVSNIYVHVEDKDVWVSGTSPALTRHFRTIHGNEDIESTTTQADLDELSTRVRFFGFYSTLHRKAVFVRNREGHVDGLADIIKAEGIGVRLQLHKGILEALAESPPGNSLVLDVVCHDDTGARHSVSLLMPLSN